MKRRITHIASLAAALLVTAALTACTHAPNGSTEADPAESFNRSMFKINQTLDGILLRPAASIYRGVVPEPGRDVVDNFLQNLSAPVVSANSFLQLNPDRGFKTFWRFVLNTTFGVGGLFDFASQVGLKPTDNDFGLTMARYGVGSGDYLFLPVIGPTNPRDLVGLVVDSLADPFNYYDQGATMARGGATILNERTKRYQLLEDINRDSLDPYATIRSGYMQSRAAGVRKVRGEAPALKPVAEPAQ